MVCLEKLSLQVNSVYPLVTSSWDIRARSNLNQDSSENIVEYKLTKINQCIDLKDLISFERFSKVN